MSKPCKPLPSVQIVRELLDYDPETGIFKWKVSRANNKIKAGSIAGRINGKGYRIISVEGQDCGAHRLAILHVLGKDPFPYKVDHQNGERDENWFLNLRVANDLENSRNRKKHSNNSSGYTGVYFDKRNATNPYRAAIHLNGKQKNLGSYPSPVLAYAKYVEAQLKHFGEFGRQAN